MGYLTRFRKDRKQQRGIALVLVVVNIGLLSLLVVELNTVTSISRRLAYNKIDQLRAHYLGKSAYKISLLRIRAFGQVKEMLDGNSAISGMVPKKILDQLWSFPLLFPIPTELPGLSGAAKDKVKKFNEATKMKGNFSALIESETSKLNLNLLLAPFAPEKAEEKKDDKKKKEEEKKDPTEGEDQDGEKKEGDEEEKDPDTDEVKFDPEESRKALSEYFRNLFDAKVKEDEDFEIQYRDLEFDDLMQNIFMWADATLPGERYDSESPIPPKKAPFYDMSELHMVPLMDDELYKLFTPNLTVSTTPGINVNAMNEATLRALVPDVTDEEVTEFFKFRDDPEQNNHFKKPEDFFKHIKQAFSVFAGSDERANEFKTKLDKRSIRIVIDESAFKITVQAQVRGATKIIEAFVTLRSKNDQTQDKPSDGTPDQQSNPEETLVDDKPKVPLQVTAIRIK